MGKAGGGPDGRPAAAKAKSPGQPKAPPGINRLAFHKYRRPRFFVKPNSPDFDTKDDGISYAEAFIYPMNKNIYEQMQRNMGSPAQKHAQKMAAAWQPAGKKSPAKLQGFLLSYQDIFRTPHFLDDLNSLAKLAEELE